MTRGYRSVKNRYGRAQRHTYPNLVESVQKFALYMPACIWIIHIYQLLYKVYEHLFFFRPFFLFRDKVYKNKMSIFSVFFVAKMYGITLQCIQNL